MAHTNTHVQIVHAQFAQWVALAQADVFVCRKWKLSDVMGKHVGHGYIFSTKQGNVIQAEARCADSTRAVCCLEEGRVYRLKHFSVLPVVSTLCFSVQATSSLLLHDYTLAVPVSFSIEGFIRFPFSPLALEDITQPNGMYLLDVIGMVKDVGVSRPTKNGSFILDCNVFSALGFVIRATLWNEAAGDVLHYQQTRPDTHLFVLSGMVVKEYQGELYLSSTSATGVYTSEKFPGRATDFMAVYNANQGRAIPPPPQQGMGEDHSLTQLLYMGRALYLKQMTESVTLNCKVQVVGIRMEQPWFQPTCPLSYCQKGVMAVDGVFWCESCETLSHYGPPAFRISLDVTDGISTVTVAFLNEVAESLLGISAATMVEDLGAEVDPMLPPARLLHLKNTYHVLELKSHTYFDYITHESFTCSNLMPPAPGVQLAVHQPPAFPENDSGQNAVTEGTT